MKIIKLDEVNKKAFLENIHHSFATARIEQRVRAILKKVRKSGDSAVIEFAEQFDGVKVGTKDLFLDRAELTAVAKTLGSEAKKEIDYAAERIYDFHKKLQPQSSLFVSENLTYLGQIMRPLKRVGLYVPGGTAPLISSVLMNGLPALCAGVSEIYISTPPPATGKTINPAIAYAAMKVNAAGVYLIGGAQAIGAMAYGTETVCKVDKIVGPGNAYVAFAKKLVYGDVDIDMVAGPSEILVLGDGTVQAKYAAADLLSQLEHDVLASAYLVADNFLYIKEVEREIKKQIKTLKRQEILKKSLKNCVLIYTKDLNESIEIANAIAPEHLEILTKEPDAAAREITNAGAMFLGEYSVEPIGDYVAGPNHVLPTSGTAAFFSPLSTSDFYKRMSLIKVEREDFIKMRGAALSFAEMEGLDAHFRSLEVRA